MKQRNCLLNMLENKFLDIGYLSFNFYMFW